MEAWVQHAYRIIIVCPNCVQQIKEQNDSGPAEYHFPPTPNGIGDATDPIVVTETLHLHHQSPYLTTPLWNRPNGGEDE